MTTATKYYQDRLGQNMGTTLNEAKRNLTLFAVPNPGSTETIFDSEGVPVTAFQWSQRRGTAVNRGPWHDCSL